MGTVTLDLEAQRRKLDDLLSSKSRIEDIQQPVESGDPGDMAADLANLDTAILILDRKRMAIVTARVARDKLKDGEESYRTCSNCEGEITVKRLIAVPEAIFCLRCEQSKERGELFFDPNSDFGRRVAALEESATPQPVSF